MAVYDTVDVDIDELLEFLGVYDDDLMERMLEEKLIDTEYLKSRLEVMLDRSTYPAVNKGS